MSEHRSEIRVSEKYKSQTCCMKNFNIPASLRSSEGMFETYSVADPKKQFFSQLGQYVLVDLYFFFVWFDSLRPSQQVCSYIGTGLPGSNQYLARINVFCSRTQHSNAGEAQTCGPSVSNQALHHWVTVSVLQCFGWERSKIIWKYEKCSPFISFFLGSIGPGMDHAISEMCWKRDNFTKEL